MSSACIRRWLVALLSALALFSLALSAPATAHKEHKKKQHEAAQQVERTSPVARTSEAMQRQPTTAHGQMGEMMEDNDEDRSDMSFIERLLDWLGRTHPVIVHFPIAFFPAALFTAIVGTRRPAFAAPVQFLVVAGGIIAPIAALLGWLDAMNADPDTLMTVHRWLGTGIGLAALGLGIWAWRKPGDVRGTAMIAALAAITAAIVVQAWYGGAMVHGIDHMNW
jgi:uncharacterized membrane protein